MSSRRPLILEGGRIKEMGADDVILGSVFVGDNPPLIPSVNALWWDSINGTLKIYYDDGDSLQWVDAVPTTITRPLILGNITYYVRTDGSDSNDGLSNTSGGAFLTIQKAIDTIATLDLGKFSATVQIANGTYNGTVYLKSYVGVGPVTISGNVTTPANVIFNGTAGPAIEAQGVIGKYQIQGMRLQTSVVDAALTIVNSHVVISGNMDFGTADRHFNAHTNAFVELNGNYTVSGNATFHMYGANGARYNTGTFTCTMVGTRTFSIFCYLSNSTYNRSGTPTYSGSVIGTRYAIQFNGACNTGGGGANFFPGSVAGSVGSGGQYV